MTLRLLNYGNYGIFLAMGNAGVISSTVSPSIFEAPMVPNVICNLGVVVPKGSGRCLGDTHRLQSGSFLGGYLIGS